MRCSQVALMLLGVVFYSHAAFSETFVASGLIDSALLRAGDNRGELETALHAVSGPQAEGMRFLIAYMPDRDLQTLSSDFLLEHVTVAYQAWNAAVWKDQISDEMFLNNILPYACVNERRDAWRQDFYQRFKPLVANAQSPSQAALILNREIFPMLNVRFSRQRPKADQSPYETIEASMASCTGLSVLLIDACRAVGIPARLAGTPLWADNSGNHSWVEIWDGQWHYTGAAEPVDTLDQAWFTDRAKTAIATDDLHAIYATSFRPTGRTFPLVWNRTIDYVHAVNVTDRYAAATTSRQQKPDTPVFDVEASLHAVTQLKSYLETPRSQRAPLTEQLFATVPLTAENARQAQAMLWDDHVQMIRQTRSDEMQARQIELDNLAMPFFYSLTGEIPQDGRSLYISLHGGGGAPKRVNDSQWENQKRLYKINEGVYLAPRSPNNTWNMWHQPHIDHMFDRLIEDLIVFENVNPNRVYVLGYSAGGDGVYRLAPRMADRWAAASMMAGHPGDADPTNLYHTPFAIQAGENDAAYDRNKIAAEWGRKMDALQQKEPDGYIHWTKIHQGRGHWIEKGGAEALPWMAQYTRNPLPKDVIWRQDQHKRFYWLATSSLQSGTVVRATLNEQKIQLKSESGDADSLIIRLNDAMLNLDEEVVIKSGSTELFRGRPHRSIATLSKTLEERGDPTSVFSTELTIDFPQKTSVNRK